MKKIILFALMYFWPFFLVVFYHGVGLTLYYLNHSDLVNFYWEDTLLAIFYIIEIIFLFGSIQKSFKFWVFCESRKERIISMAKFYAVLLFVVSFVTLVGLAMGYVQGEVDRLVTIIFHEIFYSILVVLCAQIIIFPWLFINEWLTHKLGIKRG